MTHIPARTDAPIACDMSTAEDTPIERLRAYRGLFDGALRRRERTAGAVVFAFGDDPGTRAAVDELVRREAACCPFLDYRVETVGDEIVWTVSGDERSDPVLDAFHALAVTRRA